MTYAREWTLDIVKSRCAVENVENGCWLWQQSIKTTGQPQATIQGKNTLVARWVMEHLGHNIKGVCVYQKCGNNLCLNPNHLNTQSKGNVLKTAYQKGLRNGVMNYSSRLQHSINCGWAKLDWDQVGQIRAKLASGQTQKTVAEEFKLHPKTVYKIAANRTWKTNHRMSSVFSAA
jgi:hypothetical protein